MLDSLQLTCDHGVLTIDWLHPKRPPSPSSRPPRLPPPPSPPNHLINKTKKTGYLDLLLIHWPGAANDLVEVGVRGGGRGGVVTGEDAKDAHALRLDTWRALEHLYNRGLVRYIGVSNFTEEHLEALVAESSVVPHVNQVCDPRIQKTKILAKNRTY